MELVIYSPAQEDFLQAIEFNYEEIKQELAIRLEKYQDLVYTEETLKEARADRAALNKFKNAIETRRKEIKKACLKPYEDFEVKIKDIVSMIDEPIEAIDKQVKAYEEIRKEEKLDGIKQFYADKVADLAELVPFDKIFNPRWLNVTYKETDIHKEITDLFTKVEDDLKAITELQSKYELQIIKAYLNDFDLTAALQEKKHLEEQAAKMVEYERIQKEREQVKQEQAAQEEEAQPQPQPQAPVAPAPAETKNPAAEPEKKYVLAFRVKGTKEQLVALKQFLVENNIEYGRAE
jgi:hypothetical protein